MSHSKHQYNSEKFDFVSILADALTLEGICFLDTEQSNQGENLGLLASSLQDVRNRVIDVMCGADFQKLLQEFSIELASAHFESEVYFQRVPSVRLFMPDALGTSWHTDNWYGHAPESQTFWVPVTRVAKGAGVSFIEDDSILTELERKLGDGEIGLNDINGLCHAESKEAACNIGEYLSFDARTLHGSVGNSSGKFRCSFDFRGSPIKTGVGNKPLSNYRLVTEDGVESATPEFIDGVAVKYISGASGASTKYQHILLEAYARDHQLKIIRNEAEIESIPARPVMSAYAARTVPDSKVYDHLLIYSLHTLPGDKGKLQRMLEDCVANEVRLHFVLEDVVFPESITMEECLDRA